MNKTPIIPVILAGGQGMRLWPASLPHIPKQFIKMGSHSLMFQAIERAWALSDQDILVLTGKQYLALFTEILEPELVQAGYKAHIIRADLRLKARSKNIKTQAPHAADKANKRSIILLAEPEARNTAPAIALATRYALDYSPDSLLMVITADHIINPQTSFVQDLHLAAEIASSNQLPSNNKEGTIVTFGIKPTSPETGYGYIELGQAIKNTKEDTKHSNNNQGLTKAQPDQDLPHRAYTVRSFKEKPNLEIAQGYLKKGNYLWNSGMFCFPAKLMSQEMQRYCPSLYNSVLAENTPFTWHKARSGVFSILSPRGLDFASLEKISIDYAVMEHSKHVASIVASFEWNDIGSWDEAASLLSLDKADNKHYIEDSEDNVIYSDIPIGLCGVSDLIIIIKNQRALILKKGLGQKVNNIAKKDKEKNS